MSMKNQNRSKFTTADRTAIQKKIQAEEGSGPRAQQRVIARMQEFERRMTQANSGLQRARLRRELGLE